MRRFILLLIGVICIVWFVPAGFLICHFGEWLGMDHNIALAWAFVVGMGMIVVGLALVIRVVTEMDSDE